MTLQWHILVCEAIREAGKADEEIALIDRMRRKPDYRRIRKDFLRGVSERGTARIKDRLVRLIGELMKESDGGRD